MPSSSCLSVVAIFFVIAMKLVVSSRSPFVPPGGIENVPSGTTANPNHPSYRQKSPPVSFLYELYEHEIYSPTTDSWSSRRFTQSPVAGGGGRDSTSLDPQSCPPPRNYLFDGEWKIDLGSESRDGFGWEYYVGKYDGLGRRRRRWVRTLKRVSILDSSSSGKKSANGMNRGTSMTLVRDSRAKHQPSLLRAMKDQFNFKGFGWSFYKSLLFARSIGASLRIPLSANFDCYDKYLAAPYISSSTYLGYPWVIATFLNGSIPVEAIKWLIGGIVWKIQWSLAVVSAFISGVVEALVWAMLWPWRLWTRWAQMMGIIASGLGPKIQGGRTANSLSDGDRAVAGVTTKSIVESSEGMAVSIETHIELNNSSEYKGDGEIANVTAAAIVDGPRGGASHNISHLPSFGTKSRTMFGKKIPPFNRPYSIEYSSKIQERIGVCISWRLSQERGYEYRWHFFYTFLPTLLFWGQIEEERKRRISAARRRFAGIWGVKNTDAQDVVLADSKSSLRGRSTELNHPILSSFLGEHSSTLGVSSGFPLPVDPFFSFSLLLSLSGFYYGWLLKYIRSLFVLPLPRTISVDKVSSQRSSVKLGDVDSAASEKLVSSTLKKKLPLEDSVTDHSETFTNRTRDDSESDSDAED
ncbi:hypothetical protein ACHAWF_009405 [Thalassiosira exigua]